MSTTISSIDTFAVQYPEPNDSMGLRCLVFVRIRSSDGAEGWGEAITMFPAASRATVELIEGMRELLVGRDPLANVALWRDLVDEGWWFGHRGGIYSFALSAVDIALWDLKGKLLGVSLVDLLGGARRDSIPAIASTHAFDADLQFEAERHGRFVTEQGFRGFKIGMGKRGDARLGYDVDRDIDFVRRLREQAGPDAMIMMDRGKKLTWTLEEAIRRVQGFEEFGLTWIEEPFEPDHSEELTTLRQHTTCLFAGGEREWDVHGYEGVLADGLVDVVGCDVGRVGGVTGALQVISLVERERRWFNSHAWSSAVNTAVSLALSASTDRTLLQELKPEPNPMQDELVATPIRQADGLVAVPTSPGIGVEPIVEVLEHYRLP
ncbi:mandelate racemase/muconate lactonizing enzyme family protein [Salinibacterium soli]|uniref:Mandelate racemase/muconate lactonizing enzyme family protein n=1 Tax=Antiquaquibacter soli TaxID=3064523 RepID=A0ABT9BM84_9MICO|nr:mandelate racemase/muconate lactonizing enzyme family protein [Protaetiibacter sp. WY-16]MDO7881573.1 mandelate racemase/muconate lactonizing enzyme family protein [Protaetiibacter sp. WY-16]